MSWTQAEPTRSLQQTNTSPNKYSESVLKPIEIYVFIDPLCPECWSLQPYLLKLILEYGHLLSVRTVISCQLRTLNQQAPYEIKANHSSEYTLPWLPLAIKAAELQGKNAGGNFLRKLQEYYFLKGNQQINKTTIIRYAQEANLDVAEFTNDLTSQTTMRALQCDLAIKKEMDVQTTPTIVFFNQLADEQGIKVSGIYEYEVYVSILKEMLNTEPLPAAKPCLETFLTKYKITSIEEIASIYDWSIQKTKCHLKKLQLKQIVKCVHKEEHNVWKFIN